MAKLIYVSNVSLDGFIEDEHGSFDWTEPDDDCHLFICPFVVGRGKPSLPSDLHAKLELLDERRFDNGIVYVRYAVPT